MALQWLSERKITGDKSKVTKPRDKWVRWVDILIIQSCSGEENLSQVPTCSQNEGKGPGGQQEAAIRRGVNLKGSGSRDH